MIGVVAIALLLVASGTALAKPGDCGAKLNEMCLKDPSLVNRLTPTERETLLEWVTPVSADTGVMDTTTGKNLRESKDIPITAFEEVDGGVMPMSSQYYTWYISSSPVDITYYCGYKNIFGVNLWTFYERNYWSYNSTTGKMNWAYAYQPYCSTLPIGWEYLGLVSQSSSSGSYYFQKFVQGHFAFNLAGYQALHKYPIIDFTDWADSPARITWHWII